LEVKFLKIFICFTPLHVLIAERIIEKENIKKYIFIFMTDFDNKKNKFYFKKLSKNAIASYYVILKKHFFKDMITIFLLSKKIKKYKKLVYYSGKLKSTHNRFLMYLTGYCNFITFDDGSGNISGDGYFYNPNENIVSKVFFTLFDKNLLYKNILNDNHMHYTIFKQKNVYKNTCFIDLFKKNEKITKNDTKKKEKLVILLTNAFSEDGEMELEKEIELYDKIINRFNVTHFIKHPRQRNNKIYNIRIIELKSNKIAEELIIDLSYKYDVTVIGIYSTVLINLSSIKRIKLINIKVNLVKPIKMLNQIFLENLIENKIL